MPDQTNASTPKASILAALRYRNYRLFFGGQSVSLIGTWTQRIAMAWLVYSLAKGDVAHSARMLGLQGFLGQLPMFLCAPLAGVLIDRWNKLRVLAWTQSLAMAQAFALAVLVFTGTVQLWHVFVLSVCLGVVNAFDMPTRQSMVVRMIERREDLPNAIALNSFMVNCGKLVGPTIAGMLIAFFGEGWCFLLNGLSYVGVILAVRAMRVDAQPANGHPRRVMDELREGLAYVAGNVPIRSIMILLVVVSLVGVPYTDMMPIVAADFLGGDARTLGYLRAAPGVGAILGGLWLAHRNSAAGLGRIVPVASCIFGLGLVAFSLAQSLPRSLALPVSLSLLCAAGLGMMVQMASSNTIVQSVVDDDKRGRVMSLYAMAMQGTLPWGSLLSGWVAAAIGVPATLRWGGALCVGAAALFSLMLRSWGPAGRRYAEGRDAA